MQFKGIEIEEFYLFNDRNLPGYRVRFPGRIIVESSLEGIQRAIIQELNRTPEERAEFLRRKRAFQSQKPELKESNRTVAAGHNKIEHQALQWIIREETDIQSARPISQAEINEVLIVFAELPNLSEDEQVYYRFEIGFHLRCWRDLLPDGSWANWCKSKLAQIPESIIAQCLWYWDNNEKICNALRHNNPNWKAPYYL